MKQLVVLKKIYRRKDSFGGNFHFTILIAILILAIGRISLIGQVVDDVLLGFFLGISKYLFFGFIFAIYLCRLVKRKLIFNKTLLVHGVIVWAWILFMSSCIVLVTGVVSQRGAGVLFEVNHLRQNFHYFWNHWINQTFLNHFHQGDFWTVRGHWFSWPQSTSSFFSLIVIGLSAGSFAAAIAVAVVLGLTYGLVVIFSRPRPSSHNFQIFNFSSPIIARQLFAQVQLNLSPALKPPSIKLLPVDHRFKEPLPPSLDESDNATVNDNDPLTARHRFAPRTGHRLAGKIVEAKRAQLSNQLQIDPFGRRIATTTRLPNDAGAINASDKAPPAVEQMTMIERQNDKFSLLKHLRQNHSLPISFTATDCDPTPPKPVPKIKVKEQFIAQSDPAPNLPTSELEQTANNQLSSAHTKQVVVNQLFKTFGVQARVINRVTGPTVTRFEVALQDGAKVQSVLKLDKDLKLVLGTGQLRIFYPIAGKSLIGLEIPNEKPTFFNLTTVLNQVPLTTLTHSLLVALGRNIGGELVLINLGKTPHLLIAGSTGSGKSVCINVIISCLIYQASPAQVRLLLIDPKRVELNFYEGLPHLLCPVIYDALSANQALKIIIKKIHRRYDKFQQHHKRNIQEYNQDPQIKYKLPFIVVVIDELADLMALLGREFESSVQTIAQLARAAGVHLVLSTQRPSTEVITGIIKVNIPSRIAFKVSNGVDSRTIIDQVGAEKLVGNGDMLYQTVDMSYPVRAQGTFIDNAIINQLITETKTKYATRYDTEFTQPKSNVPPAWRRSTN